jgi:hypothetical protein
MQAKLFTTLPVNPATGWQPTHAITGFWAQHEVTGPHTWAVETDAGADKLLMHGAWSERDAKAFAWSMCNGDRSRAVQVAPYYYCQAWGVVPDGAVHALDAANANDWTVRPGAAIMLGTERV